MVCENCIKGFELTGTPEGSIQPDGSYFHPRPADSDAPTTSAVIFFTDVFGLKLNNPKVLADKMAKEIGVDVWVPDLFHGKPPFKVEDLEPYLGPVPGHKRTTWEFISMVYTLLPKMPGLYSVRPKVTDKFVTEYIQKLKKERGYTTIGVTGYCFGGGITLRFASGDLVDGAVIAHPSGVEAPLVKAIKRPTLWLCAEEDHALSDAVRKEAEQILASMKSSGGPWYEFVDYEGTTHGFAARPALEYPKVKDAFEDSLTRTVTFLSAIARGQPPTTKST
ncbi:dienelactone hydrolase endo-1,3,1,4-beta-D-glucanase [Exidia glandulosa HHB12029]|uniref:Dienelactone hydrolase endo-1,3,1,4-beta-D-glucanase n=1 Tax=Exidia glandulosa HHB12029 TaxID=1314781 RepID=A0A165BHY3_EXIGL|nr:dienelactone hydrolase endo-1,3,1,4-beta-D-glucanase [Exidia glandulosa HHB12029]